MAKSKNRRRTLISPDDLLHFVELKPFSQGWDKIGLPDDELAALQVRIMCDPKGCPVIQGTNGLRKMRYAPASWNTGKSGALRVCYVHFERFYTVLLVIVYRKGDQDDIPAAVKARLNAAIARIEKGLEKRFRDRRTAREGKG